MSIQTIAEALERLKEELLDLEEKAAPRRASLEELEGKIASKLAAIAEIEKFTNILDLELSAKPPKGPKRRRTRKRGNTTTDAVRRYFEKNPGKNITSTEVVRALEEEGFTKDKRLGPNVNTALRRLEKDWKLKRRKIKRGMKVYNPSGKAEFAYRYLKPVSSDN